MSDRGIPTVSGLSDDDLDRICELCELTAEVGWLRAANIELAQALRDAAQRERSRLALAEVQREDAGRWLDLARVHLPAPPTAAEMAGTWADGPLWEPRADRAWMHHQEDVLAERCACGRHLPCRHCNQEGVGG